MPVVCSQKTNGFTRVNTPPWGFTAITPSDTDDLAVLLRGFMVGAQGDVEVIGYDGNTAILPGCIPGVQYWGLITRIKDANTTATGIIGLL